MEDKKLGRRSLYTEALAKRICKEIASGKSMAKICKMESMPSHQTIRNWLTSRPDFFERYQRAREVQFEDMLEEIVEIADSADNKDTSAAARVKIEARLRVLAIQNPARYAERKHVQSTSDVNVSGGVAVSNVDINDMTPDQLKAYKALVLAMNNEPEKTE